MRATHFFVGQFTFARGLWCAACGTGPIGISFFPRNGFTVDALRAARERRA